MDNGTKKHVSSLSILAAALDKSWPTDEDLLIMVCLLKCREKFSISFPIILSRYPNFTSARHSAIRICRPQNNYRHDLRFLACWDKLTINFFYIERKVILLSKNVSGSLTWTQWSKAFQHLETYKFLVALVRRLVSISLVLVLYRMANHIRHE